MNKYIVVFFLVLFSISITGCFSKYKFDDDYDNKIGQTKYPYTSIDSEEYRFRQYYVKAAMPKNNGKGRVQIKGSDIYPIAKIYDNLTKRLLETISLKEKSDFYVYYYETSKDMIDVSFEKGVKNDSEYLDRVLLSNIKINKYKDVQGKNIDDFSILVYGCFQPFTADFDIKENGIVNSGINNIHERIRSVFEGVSNNKEYDYVECNRDMDNPENIDNSSCDSKKGSLINEPVAIIGTGDQIYLDSGYATYDKYMRFNSEEYVCAKYKEYCECFTNIDMDCDINFWKNEHPLSAWSVATHPKMRLADISAFTNHVNNTYLANQSFDTMRSIFMKLPVIGALDDHEIRDGYGSIGDENYDDIKEYTDKAIEAYVDHQFLLGENESNEKKTQDLYQITKVSGIPVFVFDLRTTRQSYSGHRAGYVISDTQKEAFNEWIESLNDTHVIIVSSLPIFYSHATTSVVATMADSEISDDYRDVWMENDYQWFVSTLIKARKNHGVKPIILSGDIHEARQIEVWYTDINNDVIAGTGDDNEYGVLAYELIASGLANEDLLDGIKKNFKDASEPRAYWDNIKYVNVDNGELYRIRPENRLVKNRENFGAINFSGDKVTMSSFTASDHTNRNYINQNTLELNWDEKSTSKLFKDLRPNYKDHFMNYTIPYIDKRKELRE